MDTRARRLFIIFFLAVVYLPGCRGASLESRCSRCLSPSYNKVCCYIFDKCCSSKTTEAAYSVTQEPMLFSSTEESSKQDFSETTVAELLDTQTSNSLENSTEDSSDNLVTDVETSSEISVEATNSTLNESLSSLDSNETNNEGKQSNSTFDMWTFQPPVNLNSSNEQLVAENGSFIDELTTVGFNSLDNETQEHNLNISSESENGNPSSQETKSTEQPDEMNNASNGPTMNSFGNEFTTEFANSDSSHMVNDRPGISNSSEETDMENSSGEDQLKTEPPEKEMLPVGSFLTSSDLFASQSDMSATENVQPISDLDEMRTDRISTQENLNPFPEEITDEMTNEQSEDENSSSDTEDQVNQTAPDDQDEESVEENDQGEFDDDNDDDDID